MPAVILQQVLITGDLSGNATTATTSGNVTGIVEVAHGGTGLSSGTQGGIPYYNSSSTMASSAILAANSLVIGGGTGAAPSTLAIGAANQLVAVNSTGNGYTHIPNVTRTVLAPDWGVAALNSNQSSLPLAFSAAGSNFGPGVVSRFYLPYGGVIKGIIVSGNAARTGGTANFIIYKNGSTTGISGTIRCCKSSVGF